MKCAFLLGALGLCLLLILPLATFAQGQPYVGAEPDQVFDFDPDNGRFVDPLPFDVTFYIRFDRGTAKSASAKLVEATTINCSQEDFSQSCELGTASRIKHDNKEKFLLHAPALQPNRPYCFQITRNGPPSDEVVKLFNTAALQEVDDTLRLLNVVVLQQDQGYNEFRERLINRLEESVRVVAPAGTQIETPAGSFFRKGPLDQVSDSNREQFVRILNPAETARIRLGSFGGFLQTEAFDNLSSWAREAGPIAARLEAAQGRSEALDAALNGLPAGTLELPQRGEGELLRIAEGLPATGTLPPITLELTTVAADLRPFEENLVATRAQVDALDALFRRLLRPGNSLAAAAGLEDEASQAAVQRAERTSALADASIEASLSALGEASRMLVLRAQEIRRFLDQVQLNLVETVTLPGTTTASYEVRAGWYISVDAGLGVAAEIEELFTYIGTNVYFRPVNKRAPLRQEHKCPTQPLRDRFLKRFAVTAGMPLDPLNLPSEIRGVIQNRPLILGAGYRLTESLRFTLGALLFKEDDPDPVVKDERFSIAPFLSFSIDWNVRGVFSRLGGAFSATDTSTAGVTTDN